MSGLSYSYDPVSDLLDIKFRGRSDGTSEALGHGLTLMLGNSGKIIGLTIDEYSKRV